jgi:O-antigen/teichoic acid export membrane protein
MVVLGGGTFVAQFANFVFVIIIARAFGPDLLGLYSLSMAISALAIVFVSFGTIPMLVRDIGRDPAQGGQTLRALFPAQLALSAGAWTLLVGIGTFSGWSGNEVGILAAIAAYQIFVRLGEIMLSESQGHQKMQIVALVRAGIPLLSVTLAAPLVWLRDDRLLTLSVMPISACIFFLIARRAAVRLGGPIGLRPQWTHIIEAVGRAKPFFLIQLLTSAYERLGVIILGVLATREVVGEFAAGDRIIAALGVIVNVLTVSSLPALSQLAATDTTRLKQLSNRLVRLAWLIGLPVATGLFLFSEEIIVGVFGQSYAGSVIVLKVASVLMVVRALRSVLGPMSMATDRQSDLAIGRAISLVVLIISAPLLVPLFGAVGLVASMIVAESVLVSILIWRLAVARNLPTVFRPAFRIAAACALAMVVGMLGAEMSLLARIPASVLAGIAGLWLFQAVTKEDLRLILELPKRKRAQRNNAGGRGR